MPDLPNTKTSIDLELDLAAQQSKLTVLNEEIDRLRQIKRKMEEARDAGGTELPAWFHQDEKFQTLLASVSFFFIYYLFFFCKFGLPAVTTPHPLIPLIKLTLVSSWSSRKDKKALRRKE